MTSAARSGNAARREHEDRRRADHEPVGEWIRHLPEARLDVPAAREVAVELVGEGRRGEEDPAPHAGPSPASR